MILLEILNSFSPILPGPFTSWPGLLMLHFHFCDSYNFRFTGITFGIAVLIWTIDYIIPAIRTTRFCCSTYGVYGTTVGLLIGISTPVPFGILIVVFLSAFIGELLFDRRDTNSTIEASFDSFIGYKLLQPLSPLSLLGMLFDS